MTVIYGYCGDEDTKSLETIWKGLDDVKVLYTYRNSHEEIKKAIIAEKDILLLCGHGSSEGLFGTGSYAVDKTDANLIRAKYVIGIWCHAKAYAKKYRVEGFFTSMYISNRSEALFCLSGDVQETNDEIIESVIRFCKVLRKLICEDLDKIENWPKIVLKKIPPRNAVEKYNHEALEYVKFD